MTAKERVDLLTEEQMREILVSIVEWTRTEQYIPYSISSILYKWSLIGLFLDHTNQIDLDSSIGLHEREDAK